MVLKNRILAGNVSLVLLVAFLFTFILGTPGWVGKAEAAPQLPQLQGTVNSVTVNGNRITVQFTPVSLPTFTGPIEFVSKFLNKDDKTTISGVYAQVYEWSVSGSTYTVAFNVYDTPTGYALEGITSAVYQVTYDVAYNKVYFDLLLRPPIVSGGGTTTTQPATTVTDTNSEKITQTTDSATVEVKSAALEAQIDSTTSTEVEYKVPDSVKTPEKVVSLAADIVNKVVDKGKDLVINAGEVKISLPPAAIDVKTLASLGSDAKLEVKTKEFKSDEAKPMLDKVSVDTGLKPVGKVFEFTIQAVAAGVSKVLNQFEKPITLVFAYDKTAVQGQDERKLNIYKWDEETKTWIPYRGKVNVAAGTVETLRTGTSIYTVMAYNKTFADVTATYWGKDDIELMASKYVVKGMTATTFEPEATITRAQFATLVQRVLGLAEEKPATATFSDVQSDAWYYGAVEAASKAGIALGDGNGKFRPGDKITRQELATMVTRAFKAGGKPLSLTSSDIDAALAKYSDQGDIAAWAKDGAAAAVKAGIINGRTTDTFVPSADAKRAEATAMIKRLMTYLDLL